MLMAGRAELLFEPGHLHPSGKFHFSDALLLRSLRSETQRTSIWTTIHTSRSNPNLKFTICIRITHFAGSQTFYLEITLGTLSRPQWSLRLLRAVCPGVCPLHFVSHRLRLHLPAPYRVLAFSGQTGISRSAEDAQVPGLQWERK